MVFIYSTFIKYASRGKKWWRKFLQKYPEFARKRRVHKIIEKYITTGPVLAKNGVRKP
jgi:N-glycosylase/DNA lyase